MGGCQSALLLKVERLSSSELDIEHVPNVDTPPIAEKNPHDEYRYGYWRDLPDEHLKVVEEQCRNKRFAGSLMLGPNDPSLRHVLETDEATLKELNITRHQIADVLDTIMKLTHMEEDEQFELHHLDDPNLWTKWEKEGFTILNGRYTVRMKQYFGSQGNPFDHPDDKRRARNACNNYLVRRNSDNQQFSFGMLLPTLIRHNGFFEGHVGGGNYPGMTTFRVDPKTVVEFFHIQPGVDYSLTLEQRRYWNFGAANLSDDPRNHEKVVAALALDKHEFPNGDKAYLTWTNKAIPHVWSKAPVRPWMVNLKTLETLSTVEKQIDYILRRRAGKLSIPKSKILRAVQRYQQGKSHFQKDFSIDGIFVLEVFGRRKHRPETVKVFGAYLKRLGSNEDGSPYLHAVQYQKFEEHLTGWNDTIGLK